MIAYRSFGPTAKGNYLVVYQTPGCGVLTVACICSSERQSIEEVGRLNTIQREQSYALNVERAACGMAAPGSSAEVINA